MHFSSNGQCVGPPKKAIYFCVGTSRVLMFLLALWEVIHIEKGVPSWKCSRIRHPGKKGTHFKRKRIIFRALIFRGYRSFQGGVPVLSFHSWFDQLIPWLLIIELDYIKLCKSSGINRKMSSDQLTRKNFAAFRGMKSKRHLYTRSIFISQWISKMTGSRNLMNQPGWKKTSSARKTGSMAPIFSYATNNKKFAAHAKVNDCFWFP